MLVFVTFNYLHKLQKRALTRCALMAEPKKHALMAEPRKLPI